MTQGLVWTDAQLLLMMDLHECEGLSFQAVADRLGTSKGAIAGAFTRIKRDLAASESGAAPLRPENRDGSQPRRWWRR